MASRSTLLIDGYRVVDRKPFVGVQKTYLRGNILVRLFTFARLIEQARSFRKKFRIKPAEHLAQLCDACKGRCFAYDCHFIGASELRYINRRHIGLDHKVRRPYPNGVHLVVLNHCLSHDYSNR